MFAWFLSLWIIVIAIDICCVIRQKPLMPWHDVHHNADYIIHLENICFHLFLHGVLFNQIWRWIQGKEDTGFPQISCVYFIRACRLTVGAFFFFCIRGKIEISGIMQPNSSSHSRLWDPSKYYMSFTPRNLIYLWDRISCEPNMHDQDMSA